MSGVLWRSGLKLMLSPLSRCFDLLASSVMAPLLKGAAEATAEPHPPFRTVANQRSDTEEYLPMC
jgi:hypothetical protein